jgi:hypothetical protein
MPFDCFQVLTAILFVGKTISATVISISPPPRLPLAITVNIPSGGAHAFELVGSLVLTGPDGVKAHAECVSYPHSAVITINNQFPKFQTPRGKSNLLRVSSLPQLTNPTDYP